MKKIGYLLPLVISSLTDLIEDTNFNTNRENYLALIVEYTPEVLLDSPY